MPKEQEAEEEEMEEAMNWWHWPWPRKEAGDDPRDLWSVDHVSDLLPPDPETGFHVFPLLALSSGKV